MSTWSRSFHFSRDMMLTDFRYEELKVKAQAVREELHTEIERVLNDVIHFKIHIQKKLEDYELFVEEEVSHEMRALEGKDEEDDAQKVTETEEMEGQVDYGYVGADVDMRD
jgi:hypothetical protein